MESYKWRNRHNKRELRTITIESLGELIEGTRSSRVVCIVERFMYSSFNAFTPGPGFQQLAILPRHCPDHFGIDGDVSPDYYGANEGPP